MKKNERSFFGVVFLIFGAVLLIPVGLLSITTVSKRITSIDFSTIYPNIQDYNDGRVGTVLSAREYPSVTGIVYYHFKTSRGSIMLACSLDDRNSWIDSRKRWMIGQTSQPLGEDAFFKNETESEETMELAYRRYNLGVCFRISPVFTTEADKKELEETARKLDDAIRQGDPTINVEKVRVYQVVGSTVKGLILELFLRLLFLFYPNAHM